MQFIQAAEGIFASSNGLAFLVGVLASVIIYGECRKCMEVLDREEMMDGFLRD